MASNPQKLEPPVAESKPHRLEKNGDVRIDPYFWLNQRESNEVQAYLHAENTYVDSVLEPTDGLQKNLFAEMKGRIKEDDSSAPAKHGDYYYYRRMEKGKEYPIFCRKKGSVSAAEEILLDSNELAKGHSYFSIGGADPSPDHTKLVFGIDTVGRRLYSLQVMDLKTKKLLSEKIENTTGNVDWASDNETLFFVRQHPETLRAEKLFRKKIGSPEKEIYFEKDDTFNISIGRTRSGNYLMLSIESTLSSEVRFLRADQPEAEFRVFEPRGKEHEYQIFDGGDRFYVLTNWKAKNFRLMEVSPEKTERKNWKEVIAHRKDTLLEGVMPFPKQLVLSERKGGLTLLRIMDRKSKKMRAIEMNDPAYIVSFGENYEFDSPWVRYDYESMTTPVSVYDYNLETGKTELRKQREVLGGFETKNYVAHRVFARAADGVRVPISLVHKKGLRKSKKVPLLIYGYGSYGASMDPYFSSNTLSLLDRGFVFAIAHIRGGSEMGRHWYEDGRQMKKKNTFTDFISCTKFLHKQGYGSPEHTYGMGGSAGGLLMGAVMNLAPELYRGIIAQVAFVDVLTTMLDASIPLTTGEYDEWGNPNQPKFYRYIKSYSPYDNVEAKEYPNLLATTGLHDSQVQYWEPAKWVAKLRTVKKGPNLVLLKTEMDTGHGGKQGRFERLKMVALEYGFILGLEQGLVQ